MLKISNNKTSRNFVHLHCLIRNETLLKLFSFRFAFYLCYCRLSILRTPFLFIIRKKLLQYKIRVSWNGYLHKKDRISPWFIENKNLSWHIYQNKLTEKQEITKGKFVMMQIGKSVYCSIKMCI